MGNVGSLLGTIFGPIGVIFNAIFYEPIYNILMLIYNLIHATGIYGSFALSIIALTLLVRCALIPLTRKQLKSSRAMQELAPQLNALKVQYRGDPQGMMKAQQDLYKEHGVSPVSGCLPLLIQMPFLYALLFSFRNLLTNNLVKINQPIYSFLPHLKSLPDQHFLWTNLNAADPLHILPILAAFFTLIQLRMAMPVRKKPAPGTPSDPTTQATQTTMYIMPGITLLFAWTFPSGLALYWMVGAAFASVQQYFLAGWGSLFLGIPGLEHLVPPPKVFPTSTAPAGIARAGTRSLVASSSSSTSSSNSYSNSVEAEPTGRFRGFFRQIREMGAAAQAQAQEAAEAKKNARGAPATVDAMPAAAEQGGENGAKKAGSAASGGTATRRARSAAKAGPVLVKPASGGELPEKAIAREATTPDIAVAGAAKRNGTAAKSNGTAAASAARPAVAARSRDTAAVNGSQAGNANTGNGARRASGSNVNGNSNGSGRRSGMSSSSSSSSRNRSTNRAKGGR